MPYKDRERQLAYGRSHYEANKEDYLRSKRINQKRYIAEARSYVDDYKSNNPCTDCGNFFPPECMDFDHTSDNKFMNVSRMIGKIRTLSRIKEEIAKCELVCSNCHRIRTKARLVQSVDTEALKPSK